MGNKVFIHCFFFSQRDWVKCLGCNICNIRCVALAVSWVIRSSFIVLLNQRDRVAVFRV